MLWKKKFNWRESTLRSKCVCQICLILNVIVQNWIWQPDRNKKLNQWWWWWCCCCYYYFGKRICPSGASVKYCDAYLQLSNASIGGCTIYFWPNKNNSKNTVITFQKQNRCMIRKFARNAIKCLVKWGSWWEV